MVLEVRGVTVERNGRRVLDEASLTVDAGEVVAVIGPNGAGKTTLLEVIVGARRPDAGDVRGRGRELASLRDRAELLAWQADDAELAPEATVARVLEGDDPDGILVALDLAPLLGRRLGRLSRGEQRRVALAEALLTRRPLIVLDEPLAAFDALQLRTVGRVLRRQAERGTAIVLSVHQLEQALRIADRCVVLHEGRVLATGTEDELRETAGLSTGSLDEILVALVSGGAAAEASP